MSTPSEKTVDAGVSRKERQQVKGEQRRADERRRTWRRRLRQGVRIGLVVLIAGGALVLLAGAAVAAVVLWRWQPEPATRPVRVPELSVEAQAGRRAFDLYCARCHGENAGGGPAGPPLIHRTYQPAHHADIAFELAVRRGVRAHHSRFGDMPAQPAVPADVVGQITRYVRELQRANGID